MTTLHEVEEEVRWLKWALSENLVEYDDFLRRMGDLISIEEQGDLWLELRGKSVTTRDLVIFIPAAIAAWLLLAALLVGWELVAVRAIDRTFGLLAHGIARVRGCGWG